MYQAELGWKLKKKWEKYYRGEIISFCAFLLWEA